jgi:hypothetical protein
MCICSDRGGHVLAPAALPMSFHAVRWCRQQRVCVHVCVCACACLCFTCGVEAGPQHG